MLHGLLAMMSSATRPGVLEYQPGMQPSLPSHAWHPSKPVAPRRPLVISGNTLNAHGKLKKQMMEAVAAAAAPADAAQVCAASGAGGPAAQRARLCIVGGRACMCSWLAGFTPAPHQPCLCVRLQAAAVNAARERLAAEAQELLLLAGEVLTRCSACVVTKRGTAAGRCGHGLDAPAALLPIRPSLPAVPG